jgi:hypothetical protein
MKRPTLKPSDFRREADRLIRAGKMPFLNEVCAAMVEVKRNPPRSVCADLDARLDDDAETLLIRNRKGGTQ